VRDAVTQRGDRTIAVEILFSEGCAHLADVRARLQAAAAREGLAVGVTETLIATREEALRRRFPGSPTVRVEGRDVDPDAETLELFRLG
jgi:hypothetical protein